MYGGTVSTSCIVSKAGFPVLPGEKGPSVRTVRDRMAFLSKRKDGKKLFKTIHTVGNGTSVHFM